ncbi:hypothetical protein [Calothrix sp. NIES-2098]
MPWKPAQRRGSSLSPHTPHTPSSLANKLRGGDLGKNTASE